MWQWKAGFLFLFCFTLNAYSHSMQVFVSFSMPEQLLLETLQEAADLKIPATLNGLIENSMPKTLHKILRFSQKIPHLSMFIDPVAFERFGIQQVPALVVEGEGRFDVIYGNASLKEGLMRIAERGDSGFSMAR